jgi:hypothetical protein
MANLFKVTRKDGSSHIVPEASLDAIKRLYKSEGKDLKIEPHTGSVASKNEPATAKPATAKPATAKEVIDSIKAAKTIEEVNALIVGDEERVSVLAARDARMAELNLA